MFACVEPRRRAVSSKSTAEAGDRDLSRRAMVQSRNRTRAGVGSLGRALRFGSAATSSVQRPLPVAQCIPANGHRRMQSAPLAGTPYALTAAVQAPPPILRPKRASTISAVSSAPWWGDAPSRNACTYMYNSTDIHAIFLRAMEPRTEPYTDNSGRVAASAAIKMPPPVWCASPSKTPRAVISDTSAIESRLEWRASWDVI